MKKVLALVLSLVLVVGVVATLAACGGKEDASQSDFEYIQEKGQLVIGITYFAPMNYFDENNELVGFETEFATAVCEKLGVEA
ncbi:MAG: transporter substrate-binding domain-containing protein, partial [Clostridia bacterium]|nr:transporter substrate-binding domain-containing protein [Clostridia bacterium]